MAYGMESNWHPARQRQWTAADWNRGACDVVAVALSRLYGLPMAGLFEHIPAWEGYAETRDRRDTGYLIHAVCMLPDGRAIDAGGPRQPPVDDPGYRDTSDPAVCGSVARPMSEGSPFLTAEREFDYGTDIDCMGAGEWVLRHLGPTLEALGVTMREPGPHLPEATNRTIEIATGRWTGPDEDDMMPDGPCPARC